MARALRPLPTTLRRIELYGVARRSLPLDRYAIILALMDPTGFRELRFMYRRILLFA